MTAAIERAIGQFPDLTNYGLCLPPEWCWTQRRYEEEFSLGRAKMFTPDALDQFARACAWLSQQNRTRRVNQRAGDTYLLKRCMERDGFGYCTNGMFIAAAVACGFIVAHRRGTPNGWVNVSMRARNSRRHGARRPYPPGTQAAPPRSLPQGVPTP